MKISPFTPTLGGVGALIMGLLFKYRQLPFLKADTVMSGGKPVSTEYFAHWMSTGFFTFALVLFLSALLLLALRGRK